MAGPDPTRPDLGARLDLKTLARPCRRLVVLARRGWMWLGLELPHTKHGTGPTLPLRQLAATCAK